MSMDVALIEHLEKGGYNPRTSKHSDFQSLLIIRDLIDQCPILRRRAASGEIVASLRHHQQVGHADWVIDIAIGTSAGLPKLRITDVGPGSAGISMAPPVLIQIAIELKSIWTEHGKARKNRLRDFEAFHAYAHQYDQRTVAAGFLVVNSSERFWSPLRKPTDITLHSNKKATARQVAQNAVSIFRSIHLRNSVSDGPGMEAIGILVVEHDKIAINPHAADYEAVQRPTCVAPVPPNPAIGDPLHYESMIQRICAAYGQRFA